MSRHLLHILQELLVPDTEAQSMWVTLKSPTRIFVQLNLLHIKFDNLKKLSDSGELLGLL